MVNKEEIKVILSKLNEASCFVKFGRKKILAEVSKRISELESDINDIDCIKEENLKSLEVNYKNESKLLSNKFGLISSLLAADGVDNPNFIEFQRLVQTDFIEFANSVSSLKEEAKAILDLQAIEKRIEMILNFSDIYDKNIIAIGGGFSAGKSQFISSFFKDKEIKLPIGIKPVTAIPTYITAGKKSTIKGYAKKGGNINIERSLYEELSHDFIKSFPFNLKDIMPAMAISTNLDYENVCFIDTPGYDPAEGRNSYTSDDGDTAKEHLQKANVLLWLVGLNSNGTIPATDLAFLEKLYSEDRKLYIVANQADEKSEDDIEDILDNFIEKLDDADIECEGISAFNSMDSKEIAYRKISLFDFLKKENHKVKIYTELLDDLTKIFGSYEDAIKSDIKLQKEISREFKSLELDVLQALSGSYDDKVGNRINNMKKHFSINELQKHLKDLKKVKDKIVTEFNKTFGIFNKSMPPTAKTFEEQDNQRTNKVPSLEDAAVEECLIEMANLTKLYPEDAAVEECLIEMANLTKLYLEDAAVEECLIEGQPIKNKSVSIFTEDKLMSFGGLGGILITIWTTSNYTIAMQLLLCAFGGIVGVFYGQIVAGIFLKGKSRIDIVKEVINLICGTIGIVTTIYITSDHSWWMWIFVCILGLVTGILIAELAITTFVKKEWKERTTTDLLCSGFSVVGVIVTIGITSGHSWWVWVLLSVFGAIVGGVLGHRISVFMKAKSFAMYLLFLTGEFLGFWLTTGLWNIIGIPLGGIVVLGMAISLSTETGKDQVVEE